MTGLCQRSAVKVGGNNALVMRWSERAKKEGFGLVLHLDSQTRTTVDEFSTAAFIGATERDRKVTVVVRDSSTAIQSVTVKSSMQIAEGLGWKVQKRPVRFPSAYIVCCCQLTSCHR